METLTLEQIYYIGQTIAVVAVVISLIYVGLQVRQNTRTIRLSNVQALSANLHLLLNMITNNAEVADIYHRGCNDFDPLDETEQVRFRTLALHFLRAFIEMHEQKHEGVVRKETWEGWANSMDEMVQFPGIQTVWLMRKNWFSRDFRDFIDELIVTS